MQDHCMKYITIFQPRHIHRSRLYRSRLYLASVICKMTKLQKLARALGGEQTSTTLKYFITPKQCDFEGIKFKTTKLRYLTFVSLSFLKAKFLYHGLLL